MIVAGVSDLLDGAIARGSGQASPRGAFFDSVTDRVSDALLLGGVAWYLAGQSPYNAILAFAVAACSMLVSYERARAEALGLDARGGLMERAERFVFLGVALAFDILVPVLWIMLVLTAVHRGAPLRARVPPGRPPAPLPVRRDATRVETAIPRRRRCAPGGRRGASKADRTPPSPPVGAPQLSSLSRAATCAGRSPSSRTAPARTPRSRCPRRSPRRSAALGRRVGRAAPCRAAAHGGAPPAPGAATHASARAVVDGVFDSYGRYWLEMLPAAGRGAPGAVDTHFTIDGYEHIDGRPRARATA